MLLNLTAWPFTFVEAYVAPDGFAMGVVSYDAHGTLYYLFMTIDELPPVSEV